MKKRLIPALVLILALALSACGGNGDVSSSSPTDLNTPAAVPTPEPEPQPLAELSVCGIPIVSGSRLTGLAVKGTEYENGVLTLKSSFDSDNSAYPCVEFSGSLEIRVSGSFTLSATGDTPAVLGSGESSSLTVSGGSLTVKAEKTGIELSGSLTVDGCALDVTGSPAISASSVTVENALTETDETGRFTTTMP